MQNFDFLIIGGGIVGMAVARQLNLEGFKNIGLLEKEDELGAHASGRNSGVLHSGIYYAADSLKAKVCSAGSRRMQEFSLQYKIPMKKCGKVIVAPTEEQKNQIDVLYKRAKANGISIEKIDEKQLREIEPMARIDFCPALFTPETAVIDTKAVLNAIEREISAAGVKVIRSEEALTICDKIVTTKREKYAYGHLINAAGLHADRIAHALGVGKQYRILPFKGVYRKLSKEVVNKFHGAIYPTPDLRVPFLGVHLTRTVDDDVIVGPTAIPAFGRENYGLFSGWDLFDSPKIAIHLAEMYLRNTAGFRTLVGEEIGKYIFSNFLRSAQALAPSLRAEDFKPSRKVGLRAQLFNLEKHGLEMDFVIEKGSDSTHVLNAVSPAFTASFAFAEWVTKAIKEGASSFQN